MKQLFLIRHAKSSWDSATMKDFDRPLNERGKKDAPIMAKRLASKKIKLDALLSSTANRALITAQYFAEEFRIKKKDIIQIPELYHANPKGFYKVIEHADDELFNIAVISHNPGITEFINELTDKKIMDMPTCGIFAIKIHSNTWKDFTSATKDFWFFDYPKSENQ
jgi:phosphohistidine phosphatase